MYGRKTKVPKIDRSYSRQATEAAELLGSLIRAARLERNMTAEALAERAGVSLPLLRRIEKGVMGVSLGAAFEVASIVGVPLFESDPDKLAMRLESERRTGALLRKRAFQASNRTVNDDF